MEANKNQVVRHRRTETEKIRILAQANAGKANEYGWIELEPVAVPIGENDACITAVDTTGSLVCLSIGDESDAVHIRHFSEVMQATIAKYLESMISYEDKPLNIIREKF